MTRGSELKRRNVNLSLGEHLHCRSFARCDSVRLVSSRRLCPPPPPLWLMLLRRNLRHLPAASARRCLLARATSSGKGIQGGEKVLAFGGCKFKPADELRGCRRARRLSNM